MNISYNFVSLVAIGNFNPAIVSPDFLNRVCELGLGEPTEMSPQEIPVLKSLKFQNVQLTVDLTRLNIQEFDLKSISDSQITKIFEAYYRKLPYTPLSAVGVNINCEIVSDTDAEAVSLRENLREANTYLTFWGTKEIKVIEESAYREAQEGTWLGSNFILQDVNNLARRISVRQTETGSFKLNYNYEAGNLNYDRSKLDLLLNEYDKFCTEFSDFVKHLEA